MASRRRKTLSPSRVAALLRQSNQILGSLRDDDDENSYPVKKDDMSSGSSDGWDKVRRHATALVTSPLRILRIAFTDSHELSRMQDAASHDDGAFQPGSSGLKEGASGLRMSRLHSAVTCMWQGNKVRSYLTHSLPPYLHTASHPLSF